MALFDMDESICYRATNVIGLLPTVEIDKKIVLAERDVQVCEFSIQTAGYFSVFTKITVHTRS